MKIHEYQAKEIFRKYGIPVPPGEMAETPEQVKEIAQKIGKPVMIKAQVHVGGRGKAGGISPHRMQMRLTKRLKISWEWISRVLR